jgi:hypothetical protein
MVQMFRENKDQLQEELFNSFSWMNPKIQASLKGTWALRTFLGKRDRGYETFHAKNNQFLLPLPGGFKNIYS